MNEEMDLGGRKRFKITEGVVNTLLIFILGFLVGVSVKSEAKKRVTIGYGDYLASELKSDFDLLAKKAAPAESVQSAPQPEQNPNQ